MPSLTEDQVNKMAAEVAKSPQAQQLKDRVMELAKKPLHENPNVDKAIKGVSCALLLWLVLGYGAQLICNVLVGCAYPAVMSIRAIESKDKEDDTQWLTYWVVFSFISLGELFTDVLVTWIPFYWIIKGAFLIWCMSPMRGANVIYHSVIRPYFLKHEAKIDDIVAKGTKGVEQIKDTVVKTATEIANDEARSKLL